MIRDGVGVCIRMLIRCYTFGCGFDEALGRQRENNKRDRTHSTANLTTKIRHKIGMHAHIDSRGAQDLPTNSDI